MKYKYKEKIYDEKLLSKHNNIIDLLLNLEEQKDIEVQTIKIYNVKGCDGHYTDDEIDDFLEDLIDCEIIEKIEEKSNCCDCEYTYDDVECENCEMETM